MSARNVQARLVVTRTAPPAPERVAPLVIWWYGDRFHVRDETGRSYADVVGDVTQPRGFGLVPRTIEGFMDAHAARPQGHTDLYGELGAEDALVSEPWGEPWEVDTEAIAPVAAQLLADIGGLAPVGEATFLGRLCLEYRIVLDGRDNGVRFSSKVRQLVSGPYVVLRDVTDARGGPMRLRTEVTQLEEGMVDEADVVPAS